MSFVQSLKAKFNIKTKKHMALFIISFVIMIASLTLGTVTLARYIRRISSDGVIDPNKFYFESNLLTLDGASYELATDSITFDLKSYDDNLRHSEVDIDYEVSITCSDGGVQIPEATKSDTLPAGKSRVSIEYNGLVLGKTYTVTASATAPYTKTISASFTLPSENEAVMLERSDSADGYIAYLTLKTGNVAKSGIVTWQEGYVPMNAYAPMEHASGTSNNVTLEPNRVYVLSFLKSDLSAEYNPGDFRFCTANEFSDLKVISNFDLTGHITDTGYRVYNSNNGEMRNNYSVTGYIDITASNSAKNPHIQFKFLWSDKRFLICDSNKNNILGAGYRFRDGNAGQDMNETTIHYYDANGKTTGSTPGAGLYADLWDINERPVTLKWQVVINEGTAYWYIDNKLMFTFENITSDLFCVGAENMDIRVYGVETVIKAENEAKYLELLKDMGIQQ